MTKSNQKCDSNCDSFEKNRFLKAIKINVIAINGRDPLVPTKLKPCFYKAFFVSKLMLLKGENGDILIMINSLGKYLSADPCNVCL